MARPAPPLAWRAAIGRAVALTGLWVVVGGLGVAHLLVGIPAVIAATIASLRLLPPQPARPRLLGLLVLLPRFCVQSALAGWQVARLACHPALPLRPGFATFRGTLPAGPGRDGFLAWSSTMPGTVPAGQDDEGEVLVHCLDIGSPVATAMMEEERRFAHALGLGQRHG